MKACLFVALLLATGLPLAAETYAPLNVGDVKTYSSTQVEFDTIKDSTYYRTYEKLKELELQILQSPEYKIIKQKMTSFRSKMRSSAGTYPTGLGRNIAPMDWLKKNWPQTQFKSFEEAEAANKELIDLTRQCYDKFPEYNDYSFNAILKYRPEIIVELQLDLINNFAYLMYDY